MARAVLRKGLGFSRAVDVGVVTHNQLFKMGKPSASTVNLRSVRQGLAYYAR